MIFTQRFISVKNGESKIDEPIVVYRGDYELEVRFTINNTRLGYVNSENLIESEHAEYGQFAILTPYGGNIFSSISKCIDGTVSFTLTKEMLDQIEEVGVYAFQIRLFDSNKNSRVTIPPIDYGFVVREPIASEDHDNSVNNAIVGYAISKVVKANEEPAYKTFDDHGEYNKTNWKTGDRISQGKLNKIEDAIYTVNHNGNMKMNALERVSANNFNILESVKADRDYVDSKVFTMENMGQDVKTAMTGGSVAVVGENTILSENIVDNQVVNNKLADNSVDGRSVSNCSLKWGTATAHSVFSHYADESAEINLHYLITIKNVIGNISSGSKIRLMCNVKNYSNDSLIIKGMGLGTTQYNDGRDYKNSGSVLRYLNVYNGDVEKNSGSILTGYAELNPYTYNITSDDPYLLVGITLPSTITKDYNFDIFNIHINVNGTEYYGDDIEIVYADMHRKDRFPTLSSVYNEFGNPIKIVDSLSTNDIIAEHVLENQIVNRGMFYGIDDFLYVKMKSTSDSAKWALITIPNPIGEFVAGDKISIKASCIDLYGRNGFFYAGLAGGKSSNGVDCYMERIYGFKSGASDNLTCKNTKTEHLCEFTMEYSPDDLFTGNNPNYLIVGVTQAINEIGKECEFIVFDISISKNGGEFIDLNLNDIVNHAVYSNDGATTEDSIIVHSKGLTKLIESNIDEKLISSNDINAVSKDKKTTGVFDISMDITKDNAYPWFIAIIDKKNLNFEDGLFKFKWKITSNDLEIGYNDNWCIGYVSGLDDKSLQSTLPGLTQYNSNHLYYDGTYLTGSVSSVYITGPKPDGYDNLCVGVRVWKNQNGSSVAGTNLNVHCENVGSINAFSYIDIFHGYTYTDSRVSVTYQDNEYIMTNKNVSEMMQSNNIGKYVSIIGDSISTFKGWIPEGQPVFYDGKKYGVTDAYKTWWNIAISELGMKLCVNNAWSGSRVTTTNGTAGAACMDRCQNLHTSEHEPDIIIVYIGINDFNRGVELGTYDGRSPIPETTTTFREAYGVMLDKILTRYQTARVFVATLPYCDRNDDENGFPEINGAGVPLPDYNNAIRELADAFGLDIIELSKCGITFQNRKLYLGDELHPNADGMKLVARKVVNTIRNS